MSGLGPWSELSPGGIVAAAEAEPVRTGDWRTGFRPVADLAACVDCLLCWLYCPDSAILLDGEAFAGIDYDVCKGCEICVDRCPTGALRMEEER